MGMHLPGPDDLLLHALLGTDRLMSQGTNKGGLSFSRSTKNHFAQRA